MDLSALGTTLPPGLADAERDMGDKFRAAALSITNLYKSSLNYTKQAYHAGYAACLADVLSTVQSSIAGSQDATQTLSRLMDWAEARETAMAAFAAEEGEDGPAHPSANVKRATMVKEAQQSLARLGHPSRPTSAPIVESTRSEATPSTGLKFMPIVTPASDASSSSLSYQPTPHVRSSSPSMPSSSSASRPMVNMQQQRKRHSPMRSLHRTDTSSSTTSTLPTVSIFNPALTNLPSHQSALSSPTPHLPAGSKRTHQQVDFEMSETEPSGNASVVPPTTPSNRSHRSNKRRTLGTGLGRSSMEDGAVEEKERDNRRKGGRRGHGQGGGGGQGQAGAF
ncbi:hypothetical protein BD324DRAFT_636028 [Kockovaella imperatae]|uniref:Uncharacterized protein n=1 Tax=Kockovaella imperatae TaxID=4999 RepID=A0A1Y1U8W2_9TREE|nr:hypothetical protein BD324DRAFT_636028 [Kockovaella imperatae]ORX34463.1 hypothetical protein BD324DRAFT_636028 [Kockovaella imperatae]